jgi:hypothetical protein
MLQIFHSMDPRPNCTRQVPATKDITSRFRAGLLRMSRASISSSSDMCTSARSEGLATPNLQPAPGGLAVAANAPPPRSRASYVTSVTFVEAQL